MIIKKVILLVLLLVAVGYLLLPEPKFPQAPPNTFKSNEPADTESIYRQAYYTNMSRQEIMDYYYRSMGGWGIRLVLPPEDSYTVIRDQARSSYLEEVVHPVREAMYINAFVPTKPAEQIDIGGVHYLNKLTIHYIPSSPTTRLTTLVGTLLVSYWLLKAYKHA